LGSQLTSGIIRSSTGDWLGLSNSRPLRKKAVAWIMAAAESKQAMPGGDFSVMTLLVRVMR
jgi:hypothetical protein